MFLAEMHGTFDVDEHWSKYSWRWTSQLARHAQDVVDGRKPLVGRPQTRDRAQLIPSKQHGIRRSSH
ncbi:hypothetical protein MLD38_000702 [Melastoma candidum]|uniref:Uncharacterized protein n=1 Tax=Melastoma candidum TaxID=119954 RepID=A0ACB9SFV5_9MYRT|nr:hypothetical protein MLD38_000702 [Melastoma candidum]